MWELVPWPLLLGLVVSGGIGGVIAGLFGVGGGLVMVPVFYSFFRYEGLYGENAIQASVATSLAVIVFTGVSSAWFHYRRGAVDMGVVKSWCVPILGGSIVGASLSSVMRGEHLTLFFGIFMLLLGVKMIGRGWRFLQFSGKVVLFFRDRRGVKVLMPCGIGVVSAMVGVGGGSMTVPLLTAYGMSTVRAVATSSMFGFVIALPGVLTYMVSGSGGEGGLWNVGYVDSAGFLVVMPMSIVCAPIGVWCAHRMSNEKLKLSFGIFLCVVSVRMFLAVFL